MKRILFIAMMLWGYAYGQICAVDDTVRSTVSSMITYNSARINGDVSHFTGAPTSLQLRYVRVGHTDTATASSVPTTALRNLTGLSASTQYVYYYKTICGSGTRSQTIGPYTFTTLAATITYTDERPTRFNYIKVDSNLIVPYVDTSIYRAPSGPSIAYKSSNNTFYGYYPSCTCWRPLAIDSSGIIALLDGKVDSVTVSGDSLFYWKVGVSYGYILPALGNVWLKTGNSGTDTSVNWLGTNDAKDLRFNVNGGRKFTMNTNGALGIGDLADYGTSGYVLKTTGSGGAPAWVDHATLTTPINKLIAATGTNSIDNGSYGQSWAWNTLASNALTLSTTTTASSPGSTMLTISMSGANATTGRTTYGLSVTNQHTGTNATDYGLYSQAILGVTTYAGRFSSTGTSNAYGVLSQATGAGANIAGYFEANTGSTNYAIVVPSGGGSVGIGTSSPSEQLEVVGNSKFTGTIYGNSNAYNNQTGTTYSLQSSDNGKILTISNASAITLTVPAGLPAGFNCTVIQKGGGQITFTASSTTINNRQSFTKTAGQYSAVTIVMYASDIFLTQGDMQ